MPTVVRLAPSGTAVQAAIIPDATQFNDGMMTPTMLRQLNALWADNPAPIEKNFPLSIRFSATVGFAQTVVIPDATPLSAGTMTKKMVQTLNALWLASGLTLPRAPRSSPATLKFDANLTCPQEVILPAASVGGGSGGGGTSGGITGTSVQQINTLASVPPAVWTEVSMAGVLPVNASVTRNASMSGYGAHEIYINTGGQLAKWDGAAWAYLSTIAADSCIFCAPGGVIYACGHSAIASSVDHGVTWVNRPLPEVGAFGLNAIGGTANQLYVVGQSADFTKRAWRSLDGGATWAQLFTSPSNRQLFSIFALADDNVFFSGGNGVVVQWDGAIANVIQGSLPGFTNYQIWSPGTTGGGGIDAYWCNDSHALPNKQIAHAVLDKLYEENGPYPTTVFPKVDLLGLFGNGPTAIYACGKGTGGAVTGSRVYSIQTPSNLGPGTWIEEVLPSGQLDDFASAGAIWIDPATGQACVLANKNSGADSFAYTSYFHGQVP